MSEIGTPLDDGGIRERDDPFTLFHVWMEEAKQTEPNEANAMAVATADAQGRPNVRMVLLKSADATGFVFYTNMESAKGRELAANAHAALVLHWKSTRKQIRARGPVTQVSDAEADAYFATRPKDSQIGAWAIGAVARDGRPLRLRARDREIRSEIRARESPAPALLVRLSHRSAGDRVLARPSVPPA